MKTNCEAEFAAAYTSSVFYSGTATGDGIIRNQIQDLPIWFSRDAQHVSLDSAFPYNFDVNSKRGAAPNEEEV
jgi:hypothetical protein